MTPEQRRFLYGEDERELRDAVERIERIEQKTSDMYSDMRRGIDTFNAAVAAMTAQLARLSGEMPQVVESCTRAGINVGAEKQAELLQAMHDGAERVVGSHLGAFREAMAERKPPIVNVEAPQIAVDFAQIAGRIEAAMRAGFSAREALELNLSPVLSMIAEARDAIIAAIKLAHTMPRPRRRIIFTYDADGNIVSAVSSDD